MQAQGEPMVGPGGIADKALLQIFDMAEKEPFRICGQKASARAWNCSASDGLPLTSVQAKENDR